MVVAKITPPSVKLPTAPLPKPVIKSETAKPNAEQNDGAKYKPELDNSAILENRKGKDIKLTGELKLPIGCIPHPPHPIDFDRIKDDFAVNHADANGDGKLNADEFKQTQDIEERITDKNQFDRYDGDNDGYVTKEEFHQGAEADRFRDAIRDHIRPIAVKDLGDIGAKVGEAATGTVGKAASDIADTLGKIF